MKTDLDFAYHLTVPFHITLLIERMFLTIIHFWKEEGVLAGNLGKSW